MNKKPGDSIGYSSVLIEILPFDLLYTKYGAHKRLGTFAKHGLDCGCCGIVGTRLVKRKDKGGGVHVDLYTDNWVLMTVDHVIPKAKGGPDTFDNKQPLCTDCNFLKGCKEITNEELLELRFRDLFNILYKYILIILLSYSYPCTNPKVIVWTGGGSLHRKGTQSHVKHYKKEFIKRNNVTVARRLQVA